MRSPRHRPGTRIPSPSALASASPHPPEIDRELIAPDASVDRGSSLVSTMIPVGSWPVHGASYLRWSLSPARALLRGGFGGSGRKSSPRAPRPPRQRASDRTPRAVGLFQGGILAARPGSRTGTFRGQPARATRRRVSSHRSQILSDARRHAKTIRPARCLIKRCQATYRDASGVPSKQRVAGSSRGRAQGISIPARYPHQ